MSSPNVYFKQNVLVEPLFNRWYAWANLIPPASAAMYIANSHLKIMESFVASPQVHIAALRNPAMLGGPFINYDASKVGEIRGMIERTKREQPHILEFARAIKTLDDMLQAEANGFSLEALYPKVPDVLRGYVELVYDLHNHPSIRFMDGLLYKSKYYNPGLQSISLSLCESDDRSFVFSTPRLESEGRLFLDVPFNHGGLDELFRMKFEPRPYEYACEALGVRPDQHELFSTFFTEESPRQPRKYEGEGVRVRYFGHACILVETKDVSILCDPVISYKDHLGVDRYIHADLPPVVDYVLITHNHQDHIMFETLLQLRHKIGHIVVPRSSSSDRVDPSLKLILQTIGFRNVMELDELEAVELPDGRLTGLPFLGEHADLNVRTKLAYHVELLGKTMVLAADSNNLEARLYEHIRELFGEADVLFLGMECDGAPMSWLYGPLFTKSIIRRDDQSRRLNGSTYEKGISIVDILKPKQAYVYAMGQEPWLKFLTSIQYTEESRPIVESNKLVKDCRERGIEAERLYVRKEIFL
jgi:L-ascorbate metabolism protein UlaG (beta-lactamase superfamily)